MTYYVDSSAFVKLFVAEAESEHVRGWWIEHEQSAFSSDLLRTEVQRTARRISPAALSTARLFLDALQLVSLDAQAYDRAAQLDPPGLRSLDALHLTAAMEAGDDLTGIVTYDDRLAEAARLHAITVIAPGPV